MIRKPALILCDKGNQEKVRAIIHALGESSLALNYTLRTVPLQSPITTVPNTMAAALYTIEKKSDGLFSVVTDADRKKFKTNIFAIIMQKGTTVADHQGPAILFCATAMTKFEHENLDANMVSWGEAVPLQFKVRSLVKESGKKFYEAITEVYGEPTSEMSPYEIVTGQDEYDWMLRSVSDLFKIDNLKKIILS